MATLNERINEILSKLEAAASAQNTPGQPYPGRTAPQQKSYQETPASGRTEPEAVGPGAFARNLEQQEVRSAKSAEQTSAPTLSSRLLHEISPQTVIQGIVFAEILGKPVSRRRGRGRHGF